MNNSVERGFGIVLAVVVALAMVLIMRSGQKTGDGLVALQSDTWRTIGWPELIPEQDQSGERMQALQASAAALEDGTIEAAALLEAIEKLNAEMPRVEALDQQRIRIAGYVVPLEFSLETLSDFLLVPYYGACIHLPPPPANQIIHAVAETPVPVEETYFPVWLSGVLELERFDSGIGVAGYRLRVERVDRYQVEG